MSETLERNDEQIEEQIEEKIPSDADRKWRAAKSHLSLAYTKPFKVVEKMFWLYPRLKMAVDEIRMEHEFAPSITGGCPTGPKIFIPNQVSSPVARDAEFNLTPLSKIRLAYSENSAEVILQPEAWLFVTEFTFDYFRQKNALVECVLTERYLHGRSFVYTCTQNEITKGMYYQARDIGVQLGVDVAVQLGLVQLFGRDYAPARPFFASPQVSNEEK